jgi:hypothetical protein
MKLPYHEGTWFAIPLRQGGFAIGLIARATARGKVILCYFFGPKRATVPSLADVENLMPKDALRILQVGDLGLVKGLWPIIGFSTSWRRSDWPIPPFIRREPFSGRAWKVLYSDTDPNKVINEEPISSETSDIETDSLFGGGAAELLLTKLLKAME